MPQRLLDSSAVLAALLGEKGGGQVEAVFAESVISTVNIAEVVSKLIDKGNSASEATALFRACMLRPVAFDAATAIRSGTLREVTHRFGLSLGDRACLAEAETSGLSVVTADRAWRDLDPDVEIELIR